MHDPTATSLPLASKRRVLLALAAAELLAMAVWFSAAAVVPALAATWGLDEGGRAWLTNAVQLGFVAGALGSAVLNLADRVPAARLLSASALLAAVTTGLLPAADGLAGAVALRSLTGLSLAGVYPVGMKIMATWTREDRGTWLGLLVGALTVGSALPHLLATVGGFDDWRRVIWLSAAAAGAGAIIAAGFVREGPLRVDSPPFDWRALIALARQRDLALANLGYLGHMWELYAMWAWIQLFLVESYKHQGIGAGAASATAFAVIAVGGLGSAMGGAIADRRGRTAVILASLALSGGCALASGALFGGPPAAVAALCLVWGFSVVADSAQLSAVASELAPPAYVGTALTLQTCAGFLLTLVSIRLVPAVAAVLGWRFAFAPLALGPALGAWAIWALRRPSPS